MIRICRESNLAGQLEIKMGKGFGGGRTYLSKRHREIKFARSGQTPLEDMIPPGEYRTDFTKEMSKMEYSRLRRVFEWLDIEKDGIVDPMELFVQLTAEGMYAFYVFHFVINFTK